MAGIHKFILRHKNGRLRSGECFEAMETSGTLIKRSVKFLKKIVKKGNVIKGICF